MKIDETAFRTFVANTELFVNSSVYHEGSLLDEGSYFITYMRVKADLEKFKQLLTNNQPKKSKWKQLQLPINQ